MHTILVHWNERYEAPVLSACVEVSHSRLNASALLERDQAQKLFDELVPLGAIGEGADALRYLYLRDGVPYASQAWTLARTHALAPAFLTDEGETISALVAHKF